MDAEFVEDEIKRRMTRRGEGHEESVPIQARDDEPGDCSAGESTMEVPAEQSTNDRPARYPKRIRAVPRPKGGAVISTIEWEP